MGKKADGTTEEKDVTTTHRPLLWSGGENENENDDLYVSNPVDSNPETERPVDVQYPGCYIIPYNFMLSPGYNPGYCKNGGDWTVSEVPGIPNRVKVTISGYEIDFNQIPSKYPYGETSKYYNQELVGDDFWLIERAVFSAGEIWVVQPFEGTDGVSADFRDQYEICNTILHTEIARAEDGKDLLLSIPSQNTAGQAVPGVLDADGNDNKLTYAMALSLPGNMSWYVSQQSGISHYARTMVVNRVLEGYVWHDEDRDNLHASAAAEDIPLDGVTVSLLKLEGGSYQPYCYPGTTTPVTVRTGQAVNVRMGAAPVDYETGKYKFMALEAGTYAVRFSYNGLTDAEYGICDPNVGGNDTIDSDATRTDTSEKLETEILEILMPAARDITSSVYTSSHHDSGIRRQIKYELPDTGGMGTAIYYLLGAALVLPALAGLRRRRKR